MEVAGDVVEQTRAAVTKEHLFAATWAVAHGIAWLHVQREFPDCVRDADEAVALVRTAVRATIAGFARGGASAGAELRALDAR